MSKSKNYKHKAYSNSIKITPWDYLTEDNWFIDQKGSPKTQAVPDQLIVPPSLAKSAQKVLNANAAKILNGGFGSGTFFETDEPVGQTDIDKIIDEKIKEYNAETT